MAIYLQMSRDWITIAKLLHFLHITMLFGALDRSISPTTTTHPLRRSRGSGRDFMDH